MTELREDTNEATRSVAETQGTIGSAFGASVNELGTVAGRDYEKSGIYIEVSRKGLNDLDEVLDDFAANDAESPTVWDGCEVGSGAR